MHTSSLNPLTKPRVHTSTKWAKLAVEFGWICRDDGEYEEAKHGKIRDGDGNGDAIAKLGELVTDGRPACVGVPVPPHEPDGGGSSASTHHQSHHQQIVNKEEEEEGEVSLTVPQRQLPR